VCGVCRSRNTRPYHSPGQQHDDRQSDQQTAANHMISVAPTERLIQILGKGDQHQRTGSKARIGNANGRAGTRGKPSADQTRGRDHSNR